LSQKRPRTSAIIRITAPTIDKMMISFFEDWGCWFVGVVGVVVGESGLAAWRLAVGICCVAAWISCGVYPAF